MPFAIEPVLRRLPLRDAQPPLSIRGQNQVRMDWYSFVITVSVFIDAGTIDTA